MICSPPSEYCSNHMSLQAASPVRPATATTEHRCCPSASPETGSTSGSPHRCSTHPLSTPLLECLSSDVDSCGFCLLGRLHRPVGGRSRQSSRQWIQTPPSPRWPRAASPLQPPTSAGAARTPQARTPPHRPPRPLMLVLKPRRPPRRPRRSRGRQSGRGHSRSHSRNRNRSLLRGLLRRRPPPPRHRPSHQTPPRKPPHRTTHQAHRTCASTRTRSARSTQSTP